MTGHSIPVLISLSASVQEVARAASSATEDVKIIRSATKDVNQECRTAHGSQRTAIPTMAPEYTTQDLTDQETRKEDTIGDDTNGKTQSSLVITPMKATKIFAHICITDMVEHANFYGCQSTPNVVNRLLMVESAAAPVLEMIIVNATVVGLRLRTMILVFILVLLVTVLSHLRKLLTVSIQAQFGNMKETLFVHGKSVKNHLHERIYSVLYVKHMIDFFHVEKR